MFTEPGRASVSTPVPRRVCVAVVDTKRRTQLLQCAQQWVFQRFEAAGRDQLWIPGQFVELIHRRAGDVLRFKRGEPFVVAAGRGDPGNLLVKLIDVFAAQSCIGDTRVFCQRGFTA